MVLNAARRRRVALAAVTLGAAALHLGLLRGVAPPPPPAPAWRLASAVEVRSLLSAPIDADADAPDAAAPPAAPPPRAAAVHPAVPPRARAAPRRVATPADTATVGLEAPHSAVHAEPASVPAAPDPAETAPAAAAPDASAAATSPDTVLAAVTPAAAAPAAEPAPVYATRLPPSFQWRYALRRGILSGKGALAFQRDAQRYTLTLEGSVGGLPLLEWNSQGGFDDAGIAPDRFVIRQVGRSARAANFQRAAGKISYSAVETQHPLPAGAQDRLSWVVQIAGVVAAAPERHARAGAQVVLMVSGVRGDLAPWTFVSQGLRRVQTADGEVDAVELRREARHAFDTRGEVWLDPQRHHLPVRLVLSTIGRQGEVTDALTLDLESTVPR
ncbi:MAG: DUF3108 domain-containing protein [Gammaproteobacteria bacterium]